MLYTTCFPRGERAVYGTRPRALMPIAECGKPFVVSELTFSQVSPLYVTVFRVVGGRGGAARRTVACVASELTFSRSPCGQPV
jgi:hypothetical protein